jgi:hypothetical protein
MPKVNTKREIILQASGAGILITLYGIKKKTAKWKFILEKDEGTMADFLLEEDEDLLPLLYSQSKYVDTWDKALDLLDKFPWTRFIPKEVHTEFHESVWSAVQKRKPNRLKDWEHFPLEEWKQVCKKVKRGRR